MPAAQAFASALLMPKFSCMDSAILSMILSAAPVSLNTSCVTARAAPAIAKPAAAPPVTAVTTTAAITAKIAPSQPSMRLALAAFSAFFAALIDSSILSRRVRCSLSMTPCWFSMRARAISLWRWSLSSCRNATSLSRS